MESGRRWAVKHLIIARRRRQAKDGAGAGDRCPIVAATSLHLITFRSGRFLVTKMFRSAAVIVAMLIVVSPSVSVADDATSTASAFMKCARIASDAQRLSCYDRLATELIELGLSSMGTAPATQPPAPQAPTEQQATAPVAATQPPAPATPAAQSAVATPSADPQPASEGTAVGDGAAAIATTEDQFGLERIDDEKRKDIKAIQSRYVGEFRGWTGKTVFKLENGQVWQQAQSGRMAWRATNPMITIKRGFMGSYQLSVEGVNKTVRVKRIE
jgi:hypothetical protein